MLDEELKKTIKVKQEVEVQSRMKIIVADQRMIDHEIKMIDAKMHGQNKTQGWTY